MSFYERYRHPPAISDLPSWKRILFFCALAFSFIVTVGENSRRLTIYGTAPDHPMRETGQTYPVRYMGSVRYVRASEKESVDLWAQRAGAWAGLAFLGAAVLWITSPNKSRIR